MSDVGHKPSSAKFSVLTLLRLELQQLVWRNNELHRFKLLLDLCVQERLGNLIKQCERLSLAAHSVRDHVSQSPKGCWW